MVVAIIRNTETTNWNTINDFLRLDSLGEKLKPAFNILMITVPDKIKAGYNPANKPMRALPRKIISNGFN